MLVQRMALFGGNLPKPSFASVAWGTVIVPNDGGGEFNIAFNLSPITIAPGNGTYPGGGLWSGDVITATCRLYTGTGILVDTYILTPYNC